MTKMPPVPTFHIPLDTRTRTRFRIRKRIRIRIRIRFRIGHRCMRYAN